MALHEALMDDGDSWAKYHDLCERWAEAGGTSNPHARPFHKQAMAMKKRLEKAEVSE